MHIVQPIAQSVVLASAISLAALLPTQASAETFDLNVSGGGISAAISLTYGAATDAKYAAAQVVTDISGSFSAASLGISDAAILGLVRVNFATPDAGNLLAPRNFSRFSVAEGTDPISNGFITYDNLLWQGGSPPTASNYPFGGGVLDIYGLLFRIGDGRVVNLWSNGDLGSGVTYGLHVATVDAVLLHGADVAVTAVPEPTSTALLLAGLGVFGFLLKRRSAA